jgi:hypothetical protein
MPRFEFLTALILGMAMVVSLPSREPFPATETMVPSGADPLSQRYLFVVGTFFHRATHPLRLRGGKKPPGRPVKDPARLGLESLMDAMTDNWHSKQMAIKDNCISLSRYSDEDGEDVEVYKFRKGFDETKFKWTDHEKIARRRQRQAETGQADPPREASESSLDDEYDEESGDFSELSATENASIALSNGDHVAAAAGFDAVLEREPNNTAALARYAGLLLAEQRDLPRAEAMLRRTLAIDPDDTSALVHLGLVLTDMKVEQSSAPHSISFLFQ